MSIVVLILIAACAASSIGQSAPVFRKLEGLRRLDGKGLKKLAEAGNTEAMFEYAVQHMTHREHETTNMAEIVEWFRKAANLGHAEAQAYMAAGSISGINAEVDEVEALMWARKSSDAGSLNGQFTLAQFYRAGIGTPRDESDGSSVILDRIAAKGHGMALAAISMDLIRGASTRPDFPKAVELDAKANAAAGGSSVFWTAAFLAKNQNTPPTDLLSRYLWATQRVSTNNPLALHTMGLAFSEGEMAPVDHAKAFKWFKKAADAGHVPAWERLGHLQENGLGVPKDLEQAAVCYQKAALAVPAANQAFKRLGTNSPAASNPSPLKP